MKSAEFITCPITEKSCTLKSCIKNPRKPSCIQIVEHSIELSLQAEDAAYDLDHKKEKKLLEQRGNKLSSAAKRLGVPYKSLLQEVEYRQSLKPHR